MNAPWQPIEREYPRVNTNVLHLVTTKFSTLVFAKLSFLIYLFIPFSFSKRVGVAVRKCRM